MHDNWEKTFEEANVVLPEKPKASNFVPDMKAEDLIAPMNPWDDLSEEEILFWSTPFYDELQAQKELRQKHEEEERAKK